MAETTTMSIRMNDTREDLYEELTEVAPHDSKSGALDDAARYYLRMSGRNMVESSAGAVEELMQLATEQGSVTPEEIAEILDTQELPVDYEHEWSVGNSD